MELMALLMFAAVCAVLLLGYPVAFTLGGVALAFGGLGIMLGEFSVNQLWDISSRVYGIMGNETLIAVPLFVFMGVMLERSRIAEQLLDTMALLFGPMRGGLGISVVLVGALLAASTGIVGATVVTMGLLSLPTMLRRGYAPETATGVICASGTLGQVIPPSIILVLLGDVLSSAYQQAQLDMGIWSTDSVTVGDLFVGAMIPGLCLVALYICWLLFQAWRHPEKMPALTQQERNDLMQGGMLRLLISGLFPPLILIVAVLGSIIKGIATPTEAASVGAVGAMLLALIRRQLNMKQLGEVVQNTSKVTSMVFMILLGASMFSLVFNAYGGDELVKSLLLGLPGGAMTAMIVVMLIMFLLGFILDFIEITFVVVPIVGPVLLTMGLDPVWLGVIMAINLQTSFLTPPFGFALFYLRGVAPESITTPQIYRGVVPYVGIQLTMLAILALFPALATWLPGLVYGN